jgi:hypothetical protein
MWGERTVVITLFVICAFTSCKKAQDLKAFTEADYALKAVENVKLNDLDVTERKSLYDFKPEEGDSLMQAFNSNKLRLSGILKLQVQMKEPEEMRSMQLDRLKWQLLVDGEKTLEGLVSEPMLLKNGLNTLQVNSSVTLSEIEGFPNYEGLSRLTTLLSHNSDLQKHITFRIKPTVDTPLGAVELPNYITVSKPAGS